MDPHALNITSHSLRLRAEEGATPPLKKYNTIEATQGPSTKKDKQGLATTILQTRVVTQESSIKPPRGICKESTRTHHRVFARTNKQGKEMDSPTRIHL